MFGEAEQDLQLIRRAAVALVTLTEKKAQESGKKSLIETPSVISVQFALRKIPDTGSNRPKEIAIPHSLRGDMENIEMCLFVKDDDKAAIKASLKENPVEGLKVMTLSKVRSHFGRFEDKRNLCASYDFFLADDRILPMLAKPLGKVFFAKKKQPVPVNLTDGNVLESIKRARDSTHMFLSQGPCIAIRIAHTKLEIDQIVENIATGIQNCVAAIPRKWNNIQAIYVKTHESVALPLFTSLLDGGMKIADIKTVTSDETATENPAKKLKTSDAVKA